MAIQSKFHLATVRPRINITGNVAYAQHDLLFDWHRFAIPAGGACLKSFNIIDPGKDGAATAGVDFELFIAKSVNGAAPPSLGTVNSAANGAATKIGMAGSRNHIVYHKLLDANVMENSDTYTLSYNIWDQTAVGDQVQNQINQVLEGDPNYAGTTSGYHSLWICAVSLAGGEDFNTGVLIDGDQAATTKSIGSSVALVTTGTDANIVFAVGDEVMAFDEDGSGPAKVGTVIAVSANLLTVDYVEETIGDDDELLLRAPFTFNFGLEY